MSIPRRLGRLARGFVLNLQDDRLKETMRASRERGEDLRSAFEAAWRGTSEEWRASEEPRKKRTSTADPPRNITRIPAQVLRAYSRLGLAPTAGMESVDRRRRELMKKHHPDRFADPAERARAERITAEINAAHDAIERYLTRR